jgi:hypothetical protein
MHAEPIRSALGGGTPDDMMSVEVAPCHVSAVGIAPYVRRVLGVNLPPHHALAES